MCSSDRKHYKSRKVNEDEDISFIDMTADNNNNSSVSSLVAAVIEVFYLNNNNDNSEMTKKHNNDNNDTNMIIRLIQLTAKKSEVGKKQTKEVAYDYITHHDLGRRQNHLPPHTGIFSFAQMAGRDRHKNDHQ